MVFVSTLKHLAPRLRLKLTCPIIENWAFKLHYQFTPTLLLLFVVLIFAKEYIGDHIQCVTDKGITEKMIHSYCYFMGTFTVVKQYDEKLLQQGALPHPGVGHFVEDEDEIILHRYYQWVPLVLFLQAICFYMPHYIWKRKEGGRIKALVDGLQHGNMCGDEDIKVKAGSIPSKTTLKKKLDMVKKDFMLRLSITRTWSMWLVGMEITNLVNIVLQILIVDYFLNGRFVGLGPSIIGFRDWDAIDNPLERIFPTVTKCTFRKYGPSGTLEKRDALCVMALNIVHEKIYAVLWFWFLFLLIVSVLAVIWRIACFFLYRQSPRFNELIFQKACYSKLDTKHVIRVVDCCQFEDWLFLYYLAKNMHAMVFQELLEGVADELDNRKMVKEGYKKVEPEATFVDKIGFDDEMHKDAKKAT